MSVLNSTRLHASSNSTLNCNTLWFIESQLSAHYTCINNVPEVITDAGIFIVVADLYSALPHWWLCAIHQSDVTIHACCERKEIIIKQLLSVTLYREPISVVLKTHYKRSDFQEWNLGNKVCRCSCQQYYCTQHWHRYQYPFHIHQYLEGIITEPMTHGHKTDCVTKCAAWWLQLSNLCSWIHLLHSHQYSHRCNFQWYSYNQHFCYSHSDYLTHTHWYLHKESFM